VSLRGIGDLERGVRRAPHLNTVRLLADALHLGPTERKALLAAAPDIAAMIAACPQLSILATSREALRLRGGHVVPLPPFHSRRLTAARRSRSWPRSRPSRSFSSGRRPRTHPLP
jgi:predicted ATPase